ncbi:MAG: DUF4132 domain-containing protein, partial [Myxococcales bacterium]|nr:DUF4132 domain-containing protein [Myxococcales bacterium]
LRYLAGIGHRDAILVDAAAIGVADTVRGLLDDDWLLAPKAKRPKLPGFADPASLPTPSRDGVALDADAVHALLERLAVSTPDAVHPAVVEARAILDPATRAAFAWALFEAWMAAGADPKQSWAMMAVGFLGGDAEIRQLAALARDWPGNKASARAQLALDALLVAGSETALVQIDLLAERSKYPAFKAAAADRIALLADIRGLTVDALQDRLVPRLGLDDDQRGGAVSLDFGGRTFAVRFDEHLKPVLYGEDGKLRKALPKPGKGYDPALAKAAKARLTGLKKDAASVASVLLARLERTMVTGREIAADVFLEHMVGHPLVVHLARRLV